MIIITDFINVRKPECHDWMERRHVLDGLFQHIVSCSFEDPSAHDHCCGHHQPTEAVVSWVELVENRNCGNNVIPASEQCFRSIGDVENWLLMVTASGSCFGRKTFQDLSCRFVDLIVHGRQHVIIGVCFATAHRIWSQWPSNSAGVVQIWSFPLQSLEPNQYTHQAREFLGERSDERR
jgi:hypothetical protein